MKGFLGSKKNKTRERSDSVTSTGSSIVSSDSTKSNDDPGWKEKYIKKIINTLAKRPEAFTAILNAANKGEEYWKAFASLEGIRVEAGLLVARFGEKAMITGLLNNGLLEALASVNQNQAQAIMNVVLNYKYKAQDASKSATKSASEDPKVVIKTVLDALKQPLQREATKQIIRNFASSFANLVDSGQVPANIKAILDLTPEGKFANVVEAGTPVIDAILDHPNQLQELVSYTESPDNLKALAASALRLISHNDVFAAISTKEVMDAIDNDLTSDLERFAGIFIDIFTQNPTLINIMMGQGGWLEQLLPRALDLPHVQEKLGINEAQAKALKPLAPELSKLAKDLATIAMVNPDLIKDAAKALKEFKAANQETKADKLNALVQAGLALVQNSAFSNILFNKELLKKIAKPFVDLPEGTIDFLCDNKEQILNILSVASNQKEFKPLLASFLKYQETKAPEDLLNLASSASALIGSPEMAGVLTNKELITKALALPIIKENLTLFKGADLIQTALSASFTTFMNGIQSSFSIEGMKNIYTKAIELAKNSKQDLSEIKKMAIGVIDVLSKEDISKHKDKLTAIIDSSLSALKKDSIYLKLLKPLGINGEFIAGLFQEMNNKEGIVAIKKYIEDPSKSNAIGALFASTKTTAYILGHVAKSLILYLGGQTKEKTTQITSWVAKVQKSPTNNISGSRNPA
ncbi:MAG: hypothetical protein AABY27_05630 [Pseudomonadota bacterium]